MTLFRFQTAQKNSAYASFFCTAVWKLNDVITMLYYWTMHVSLCFNCLLESVFPEIKMKIIPCGDTDKANTIINYPRFKEVEAILIHTGTNNLENDNMDSKMIANRPIEISNSALQKFPTAKIILSEILPRNDEFNMKGTEVNSILAGASVSAKFHLVKHSNLAKQSFFFDRKHLNKFRGVAAMRRNISNVFSSLFPGVKINENSLQQSGYSTRTLFPPRERYDNTSNTSRSIIHHLEFLCQLWYPDLEFCLLWYPDLEFCLLWYPDLEFLTCLLW